MSDVKDFYTHYCHFTFFWNYLSMLSLCSCFFLSCQSNNPMLLSFTSWVLLHIYYLLLLPNLVSALLLLFCTWRSSFTINSSPDSTISPSVNIPLCFFSPWSFLPNKPTHLQFIYRNPYWLMRIFFSFIQSIFQLSRKF